ncbi:GAF and ANTAR domain-containing protein [Streptomyces sp. NRRL B-3229]|uniref:GAF and ANTAR domain-containing protein n=1 Tax=Streptomyces sp. NRRL B-3229 TaxID=1463836 RepID=UPI0004BF3DF0|nr:GAF and ANTAR domain-containing protein [Streptomyces sp. NRRL B-3229]
MKEQLMARTFVELADSLVADFDLMDFLRLLTDRCVDLLDASAAGVLLADRDGVLRVMATSDERVRLLELFQLQNHEGPCLDCFHTGITVSVPDLRDEAARWPLFTAQAQRLGFTAVQALPMRLRDEVVGALNLFHTTPAPISPAATPFAQALADVATISLLQQRTTERSTLLNEQTALNSRVLIEQAKGKLAERRHTDMERTFTTLRAYARAFVDETEHLPGLTSGSS